MTLEEQLAQARTRFAELQEELCVVQARSFAASRRARLWGVGVLRLVEYREELRKENKFKEADRLREILLVMDYTLSDKKVKDV